MKPSNQFMQEAIQEAYSGIRLHHGGPFGSVVVKNGTIVGRGHNRVLLKHDPTCHGEMEAIRNACEALGTHDLSGCQLYTTAAPCPMCKGAILWANIEKVYYGCTVSDTDRIGFRDEVFYANWDKEDLMAECDREDCLALFQEYSAGENQRY